MSDKKTLTVKLVKSIAGTRQSHRDTVRGLGYLFTERCR